MILRINGVLLEPQFNPNLPCPDNAITEEQLRHVAESSKEILTQMIEPNRNGEVIVHNWLHQNDPTGVYDWATGAYHDAAETAVLSAKYTVHVGLMTVKGLAYDLPYFIADKTLSAGHDYLHSLVQAIIQGAGGG